MYFYHNLLFPFIEETYTKTRDAVKDSFTEETETANIGLSFIVINLFKATTEFCQTTRQEWETTVPYNHFSYETDFMRISEALCRKVENDYPYQKYDQTAWADYPAYPADMKDVEGWENEIIDRYQRNPDRTQEYLRYCCRESGLNLSMNLRSLEALSFPNIEERSRELLQLCEETHRGLINAKLDYCRIWQKKGLTSRTLNEYKNTIEKRKQYLRDKVRKIPIDELVSNKGVDWEKVALYLYKRRPTHNMERTGDFVAQLHALDFIISEKNKLTEEALSKTNKNQPQPYADLGFPEGTDMNEIIQKFKEILTSFLNAGGDKFLPHYPAYALLLYARKYLRLNGQTNYTSYCKFLTEGVFDKEVKYSTFKRLEEELNSYGKDHWELCGKTTESIRIGKKYNNIIVQWNDCIILFRDIAKKRLQKAER